MLEKQQILVCYTNFYYSQDVKNILDKAERVLCLRNFSPKTCKAYVLYIKNYITFSKNAGIKNKQKAN